MNDWQDDFPIHDEVEDCCGATRILETHEGWEFELRIRDALE